MLLLGHGSRETFISRSFVWLYRNENILPCVLLLFEVFVMFFFYGTKKGLQEDVKMRVLVGLKSLAKQRRCVRSDRGVSLGT